jgi:acyl-coenzyme A synthetase/AMP-(fatty) acid ligase
MFYMAGVFNLLFCPLVSGSRIVLGARFSGAQMVRFWEQPMQHGVNHLTLTPTMALSLARLYRTHPELIEHLSHYQAVISTSSTLVPAVAERFRDTFGVPLQSCYGVTEVGGSITLQHWEDALSCESVGQWQPGVEILAGADAEHLAELRVRTPFMMRGYLVNGNITSGVDEDGFFRTGDLGYMKGGRLFITGRENDFVKKGGEFVPLLMIEDLVLREEGVIEAAVVAVPDDYWGNKIVLFYVPRPDREIEDIESALTARFDLQLRKVEQPDKLIAVPRMPKTSIGKTIKRELVRRYTL